MRHEVGQVARIGGGDPDGTAFGLAVLMGANAEMAKVHLLAAHAPFELQVTCCGPDAKTLSRLQSIDTCTEALS